RAIRLWCLDCSGGSPDEVAKCKFGANHPAPCDLHAFRFGKNPNIKITDEQRAAMAERVAHARHFLPSTANRSTEPDANAWRPVSSTVEKPSAQIATPVRAATAKSGCFIIRASVTADIDADIDTEVAARRRWLSVAPSRSSCARQERALPNCCDVIFVTRHTTRKHGDFVRLMGRSVSG